MSKPSCMISLQARRLAGPKRSHGDLLAFAEAEAPLPVPWGCWAQFFPMRCDTECGLITRCMGLRALQMARVSDGSVTMSTKLWVTHCVRRILKTFGPLLSRRPASWPGLVGEVARHSGCAGR